jgi:hypothetical protein
VANRWDRCDDGTSVGVLTGEEVAALRSYADGIVRLAEYGLSGCTWVDGVTAATGRLVPNGPISDERLAAIVSDHLPVRTTDWEIAWHGVKCLRDTIDAARRVAATLPASGAVVVLKDVRDIDAWCRLIGDVLAALGPYRTAGTADEDKVLHTEAWLQSLLCDLLYLSWCSERDPRLVRGGERLD